MTNEQNKVQIKMIIQIIKKCDTVAEAVQLICQMFDICEL